MTRIEFLADHAELIPTLKAWFEAEWGSYYGPGGPGDAHRDLLAYANRGGLPVGVVAFCADEPCGMAALKAESITSHRHLSPWAAVDLVSPFYRRRGIGSELVRALEDVARDLGHTRIYCGTSSATRLPERRHWQFMERVRHDGEPISIYQKAL